MGLLWVQDRRLLQDCFLVETKRVLGLVALFTYAQLRDLGPVAVLHELALLASGRTPAYCAIQFQDLGTGLVFDPKTLGPKGCLVYLNFLLHTMQVPGNFIGMALQLILSMPSPFAGSQTRSR